MPLTQEQQARLDESVERAAETERLHDIAALKRAARVARTRGANGLANEADHLLRVLVAESDAFGERARAAARERMAASRAGGTR